jgi:hypothetical protein
MISNDHPCPIEDDGTIVDKNVLAHLDTITVIAMEWRTHRTAIGTPGMTSLNASR